MEIMRQAADAGFSVHLYYVTTRDPDINVARVGNRVARGGHPVDEAKIRSRYYGSLANLADALRCADEAYLFDNSTDGHGQRGGIEVACKQGNVLTVSVEDVPDWFTTYVDDRL